MKEFKDMFNELSDITVHDKLSMVELTELQLIIYRDLLDCYIKNKIIRRKALSGNSIKLLKGIIANNTELSYGELLDATKKHTFATLSSGDFLKDVNKYPHKEQFKLLLLSFLSNSKNTLQILPVVMLVMDDLIGE